MLSFLCISALDSYRKIRIFRKLTQQRFSGTVTMYLTALHVFCMLVVGISAYKSTRSYYFNGRLYKEIYEQPWFRNPHRTHLPVSFLCAISERIYFTVGQWVHFQIPAPRVNESGFGKHDLPDDDVFVEHDWTDEEKTYLPCLDLICVCPYYGGEERGVRVQRSESQGQKPFNMTANVDALLRTVMQSRPRCSS